MININFLLNQIYHSLFEFIKTANKLEELQVIWILSCGIYSWYTQSERFGAKCIYYTCINRSPEIGVDFASFAAQMTPQWKTIVFNCSDESLDYLATVERTRWSADHYVIVFRENISL